MTTTPTMTNDPAAEGTSSAEAVWDGGMRCTVVAHETEYVADEPASEGGEDTGPMPTEHLLAALASCYTLACAWTARRRGVELPDLAVQATGTYEHLAFGQLTLTVTTSLPRGRIEPLLEPALRVCYVSNTIRNAPPIDVRLATPA